MLRTGRGVQRLAFGILCCLMLAGRVVSATPPDPKTVALALFEEMARIYRPSGGEEQIQLWILKLVEYAQSGKWPREPVLDHEKDRPFPPAFLAKLPKPTKGGSFWQPGTLATQRDRARNLVVRVPGTGPYAAQELPVGLQAHVDMVLAVAGIDDSGKVQEYFKRHGITLEIKDGFLQSKDRKTTIGADNGMGVVTLLYFLFAPDVPHPPLELIFTIDEEVTMKGAQEFDIPLSSPVILNFDSEEPDKFFYGCQGTGGGRSRFQLDAGAVPARLVHVRLGVTGLLGGHSACAIYRRRASSVMESVKLARDIVTAFPSSYVVSARAGDTQYMNKIPSAADWVIAVPASAVDRVLEMTRTRWKELGEWEEPDPGEEEAPKKFSITAEKLESTGGRGISSERFLAFTTQFLKLRSGVLTRGNFEGGANSSSSTALLELTAAGDRARQIDGRAAFLARSYYAEELRGTIAHNGEVLRGLGGTVDLPEPVMPWLTDQSSPLYKLVEKMRPGYKPMTTAGSLELAVFATKFPTTQMISFGADIRGAHGPDERMREDTIAPMIVDAGDTLAELGKSALYAESDPTGSCPTRAAAKADEK